MHVLLLSDEADRESVWPTLGLVARTVRRASLGARTGWDCHGIDVAVIDARTQLTAARRACREIAAAAPQVALVVVVPPEDFVAVNLDWHLDDIVLATARAAELHARLTLAIARHRKAIEGTLQFGDLTLHPASYTASLPDRQLDLTLTEFKLLNYLVQNPGRAFTRNRLMREVWGRQCSRRTVDVHVQRLRAKLGTDYGSIVDTVRGVGYMAANPKRRVTAEPQPMAIAQ